MKDLLKIPPISPEAITSGEEIACRLEKLISRKFCFAPGKNKARTDGSNLRKMVSEVVSNFTLPAAAHKDDYTIIPPKAKGVTKIRREWIDTFMVTTGSSYNLQVWNRNPSEPMAQIEYSNGSELRASDIRFILVRVHPEQEYIRCITILTPDYIVKHFGKFGKQTVKEQLIIRSIRRDKILSSSPPLLFYPDEIAKLGEIPLNPSDKIHNKPESEKLISLATIKEFVTQELIGKTIPSASTKNRGQALELIVAEGLGYTVSQNDFLVGGYPDIPHQALEIKVQDAATVDLGKYSPQFEVNVPNCPGFTTRQIRYLIALTDTASQKCIGAILCPGSKLGEHFTYVADKSFKCQRSIPMEFFDTFDGQSVFNPDY